MLYLGEDGSGHCPQTIAECTFQTGISYGLIKTSFPQKNSFCCNNEEWLFQTYVDIFVNGKKLPYNLYMCQAPLGLCGGEKIYDEKFFDKEICFGAWDDLCKQEDQYNWKELGFCSDTEDEYIPPYIPPQAYYPGGQQKFCRNGCRYSSIRKACISMKNGKKC